MLESAVRSRVPIEILGWGEKWKGLWQKLDGSLEKLKSLPDDCIVMFTDGFDVVFTEPLLNIKEKFLRHKTLFLSSAECGCWPQILRGRAACYDDYPESPTLYRYLNSGSWLGYAFHAEKLLDKMVKVAKSVTDNANVNDQELLSDMYASGKHNITIDHYATIFQSLHSTDPPDLEYCHTFEDHMRFNAKENIWENTYTKSRPSVFHFNGGGKKHHLELESRLPHAQARKNPPTNVGEIDQQIYSIQIKVANGHKSFEEICPGHLEAMRR